MRKRILSALLAVMFLFTGLPGTAWAVGEGNMEAGGGQTETVTGDSFWNGDWGIRFCVVDVASQTVVSATYDASNRNSGFEDYHHYGKTNKFDYRNGASLVIQKGLYSWNTPPVSIPTIVRTSGAPDIKAIKDYFTDETVIRWIGDVTGMAYDTLISGDYKLFIEPILYYTFDSQKYAMTATEAALFDRAINGLLLRTMGNATHQQLPLSLYLEKSDLGFSKWSGAKTGIQNNTNIINYLGMGIVSFIPEEDPEPGTGGDGDGPTVPISFRKTDPERFNAANYNTGLITFAPASSNSAAFDNISGAVIEISGDGTGAGTYELPCTVELGEGTFTVREVTPPYEDPRWCTFNQAKKKGWSIKKGAKGVPVEFWSAINIRTKEVMDFREAAQKIRDGEAEQGDFRYYNRNFHVFNAAQIEGMPELKRVTPTADIGLIRQNRDTLIKNMAVGFDGNGADCHYSPAQDKIVMPPESDFRDTYGYMCSFLHEAGHATGAPGRLGRGFGSTREEYAIEELRAEIASAMTSQQLGIPLTEEQMQSNLDLHKAYIQGWAQAIKDAPKVLFDAIKDAEQISDYLIDKGEFRQVIEAEQVKEAQEPGAMEEASRDHGEETVKQITVLVVEPGKVPYTKEIGDDWRAFQAEVGGTFQIIYPGYDPVGLVCNDDGKLLGLPLNRGLLDDDGELYDVVAGTFFLVGLGGGGTTVSLTEEQIREYEQRFHDHEQFVKVNGKLVCIPSSKDPDLHKTGERVSTPRGSFAVTSLTREQMEAAGYGCHHRSEDGKYLIMGDGTRAFAVAAEAPELKKELPRQEISFCRISNHYYAKVQTEKGVEQCAMQFRPGRYFFETAAGKVHMLTPTEVERYMKFVAEEVNLEAVRQQTELLRQKTAGQIEQRNKTI